jgi:geranylgeranyl transferase type-2 subunit beta
LLLLLGLQQLKVCYSHWVLSSMAILDKLTWIDGSALTRFILSAQVRRHTRLFCHLPYYVFWCLLLSRIDRSIV